MAAPARARFAHRLPKFVAQQWRQLGGRRVAL